MMRVGPWAVALASLALLVGWLLLRGEDDAGEETDRGAGVTPTREAKEPPLPRGPAQRVPASEVAEAEPAPAPTDAAAEPAPRPVRVRPSPTGGSRPEPRPFDTRALEEAGYRAIDAAEIRKRWKAAEAQLKNAHPPGVPGVPGSAGGPAPSEERDFDAAMREMLGDEDYDAGRYATGRNNRLEILEDYGIQVMQDGSKVPSRDLQRGDVLVAFDGRPIYTMDDYSQLVRERRQLGPGNVVLTIERDGRSYDVVVEGGTIFARFASIRVPPR
jgi:hypothetical protein